MLLEKYGKHLNYMNNIEINLIQDKNYWDKSIDNSKNSSLFSKSIFLDLWYKEYELYEIKYKQKSLAFIVFGVKNYVDKIYSFPYQNLIYTNEFEKLDNHSKYKKNLDILKFFFEKILHNKKQIFFSLHYLIEDVRPFLWYNYNQGEKTKFKYELKYTAILDLKNKTFDDILNESRNIRKQEFNKSNKNNLSIEFSKDIELLNNLHLKTFERQKQERKLSEKLLVTNIAKKLIDENKAELIFCKKGDNLISAIVVAYDKLESYYLIGANDPDYRNLSPNTFLLFNHLEKLIKNGFTKLDFLGVNSPLRGDFKLSFNPKIYSYYNFYKYD